MGSTEPVTSTPVLISIQVGQPRWIGKDGAADGERPVLTAFIKEPVPGAVRVSPTGLAGDRQADERNHGGSHMALLAYAAAHYPRWHEELGRPDMTPGSFAENLTIDGLDEATVCIGDTYAIGEVRLQVSQPRQPCFKISRRWQLPDLTKRVEVTGRTGWYSRVMTEGTIEAGTPVVLIERPYPEWTIARTHAVRRNASRNPGAAAALAACTLLSPTWRGALTEAIGQD